MLRMPSSALRRKARCWGKTLAGPYRQKLVVFAFTAGTILVGTQPVFAEFQIQEAGIEKGEKEVEYRGAYHWGVPAITGNNENANDIVHSHELELSYGLTDWWLLQFTAGFEQPLGEDLRSSDVEFETEFALIKREGDGLALSFQGGYEKAIITEARKAIPTSSASAPS